MVKGFADAPCVSETLNFRRCWPHSKVQRFIEKATLSTRDVLTWSTKVCSITDLSIGVVLQRGHMVAHHSRSNYLKGCASSGQLCVVSGVAQGCVVHSSI